MFLLSCQFHYNNQQLQHQFHFQIINYRNQQVQACIKIKHPQQNLDRLRTQFKLVESIEAQLPAMQVLVK